MKRFFANKTGSGRRLRPGAYVLNAFENPISREAAQNRTLDRDVEFGEQALF
jgi:hypothetical protein